MNYQKRNEERQEPIMDGYVENQSNPDDEAKAQKFILTKDLSDNINWLSDIEGVTKTEIVKKALHSYFSRSHYLNNARYFLEKANGPKVDLSKVNSDTEVNVRWCNGKTDPVHKSIFVACHILNIDGDSVLIHPIYYPDVPMFGNAAKIYKSEQVVPEFIDFDPHNIDSVLPYLHQLTYEVNSRYLWPITPISNDL